MPLAGAAPRSGHAARCCADCASLRWRCARWGDERTLSTQRVQAVVARSAAAEPAVAQDGLMFPRGPAGAWDEGGVANPVVRVYQGDDEQRWYMWYTGCGPRSKTDAALPAAGSIGARSPVPFPILDLCPPP